MPTTSSTRKTFGSASRRRHRWRIGRSSGSGTAGVVSDASIAVLHDPDDERHQFLDPRGERALGHGRRVEVSEPSPRVGDGPAEVAGRLSQVVGDVMVVAYRMLLRAEADPGVRPE
jgi:hypothetical protein